MRLFEAIVEANHRARGGDARAGIHPEEFADALPVVALTCIDPRLNPLLPEVLGLPETQFIWLRNAGNILTGPLSSMTRSLALACAIKGGREIAVIGHSDCAVRKTSVMALTNHFEALGIPRRALPDNLNEFFGLFASESQNVRTGVEFLRESPLISPQVPLHGLLLDLATGKLDWVVNGYDHLSSVTASPIDGPQNQPATQLGTGNMADFPLGEMTLQDFPIGEKMSAPPERPSAQPEANDAADSSDSESAAKPPAPDRIPPPLPRPIPMRQPWKKRR